MNKVNVDVTPINIYHLPQEYKDLFNLYEQKGATDELVSLFEQLGLGFLPNEPTLKDAEAFKNYLVVSYLLQNGVSLWDITTFYPLSFLEDEEDMEGVIDLIIQTNADIHSAVYDAISEEACTASSEDPTLCANEVELEYCSDEYVNDTFFYLFNREGILVSNTGKVLEIGDAEIPDVCIPEELFSKLFC